MAVWRSANFYSLELERNGKAAGERMNRFFKQRNATELPYLEVFVGDKRVEAFVLPPSRIERFNRVLGLAQGILRSSRWRKERRALLDPPLSGQYMGPATANSRAFSITVC